MATIFNLQDRFASAELSMLAEAVARGEYSLLLGAGASIGGTGGDGRQLPSAKTLTAEMIADFSLPADPAETSLALAYDASSRRTDSHGASLSRYLENRFENCTPPTWMEMLPEFVWRRIWTLNIDDALEAAYLAMENRRQETASFNWVDPHVDSPDALQLIHLHGKASNARDLVFSIVEYLRATARKHTWHRMFGDHFAQQPFIVVGARLSDEFDLAAILAHGSTSRETVGLPSIVVLKEVSALAREQLENANLVVLETTADAFFFELSKPVAEAEVRLAGSISRSDRVLSHLARRFLEQFVELRNDAPAPLKQADFYAGHDPTWADIQNDRDAVFAITNEVSAEVVACLKADPAAQRVELLHGPLGTGKTTALLRVGKHLIREGYAPYLFRGDSLIDVEAILWWAKRVPRTVLLIDGLADHATAAEDLLERAAEEGQPLALVATEREKRVRQIYGNIDPSYVNDTGSRFFKTLTNQNIYALVDKLRQRSRMGRLTRSSLYNQRGYFMMEAERQLWAGMSGLEGGAGFVHRIRTEFADVSSRWRDTLASVAITYSFGYPLPIGVVNAATGIDPRHLLAEVRSGGLDEWVRLGRHGLEFRHRFVAAILLDRAVTSEDRYRLTLALAKALAPLVDIAAIRRRAIPYRICRNLLDAETVADFVGARATDWYEELEALYGWNARYWEQRALACVAANDLPAARSYAERAVGIYKDPFSLTTLASVMLRQATAFQIASGIASPERYWAGVSVLSEAKGYIGNYGDHASAVFLTQTLAFCDSLPAGSPVPDDVRRAFEDWLDDFRRGSSFGYAHNVKWLEGIHTKWLKILVERSGIVRGLMEKS